jgi:hypothetical protein
MWAAIGLALSAFTAIFAFYRAEFVRANYYAAEVYGMTAAIHRRYALTSLGFAAAFCASFVAPVIPTVPLLAVYTLVAIFYFSSFARGFSDEER